MRECANCGAKMPDEDVFCGDCGARLGGELAAPPVEADVVVTDAASAEVPKADRRPSLRFVVIGGVVAAVALVACSILVIFLIIRARSTNESVFLGGSLTPTATSPPRVSVPATSPVLEETFDDNARQWSVWEDEHGEKGVENGVYYVVVTDTGWASWATAEEGLTFDDFVIQVEGQAVEGPNDNGYGLVFRYQDNDNFYYYKISSDGYYSIGKMVADEWETLVGWTESDLIQLGRQTNALRVVCDGSRMIFFVNGYQLEELTDEGFEAGSVGFIAEAGDEPGVRVHFDNLKVWATE